MPNQELAFAWPFGEWSGESRYPGAFSPVLEMTFVAPLLPTRLTAPGFPRMVTNKSTCDILVINFILMRFWCFRPSTLIRCECVFVLIHLFEYFQIFKSMCFRWIRSADLGTVVWTDEIEMYAFSNENLLVEGGLRITAANDVITQYNTLFQK